MAGVARVSLVFMVAAIILAGCSNATPAPPHASSPTLAPSPTAGAADSQVVTIAVDSGNPPFMYYGDQGAAGLYPVLIQAVFERMAVDVEVVAYPWKRTLQMGERGEVGVGGIYKNAERLLIYDYSAPLYSEKLVLYVRKGQAFDFNILDDLAGKSIGVILGWSYGDEFDQARDAGLFDAQAVASDSNNFEKLMRDRVDCVIAIDLAADMVIREMGYEGQVEKLALPVAVNDTHVVFAKIMRRGELLAQFDATLAEMQADGTYAALVEGFEASD